MRITMSKSTVFYGEPQAFSGVKMAARSVMSDFEMIFGTPVSEFSGSAETAVIYGTIGSSEILEKLERDGKIDLSGICGKREVYLLKTVDTPCDGILRAVVIAGSDKRGTIYGLYRLSELMGVSPLSGWNGIPPEKRSEVVLKDIDCVSKEPSVKYRGFFINDEWPAFGNWANIHFGGINKECYKAIFELLLRLKGNYLWPAMWASDFSLDGPGLASAELADEMGVVMSTSHHEPCCRSGNEYGKVRGKGSKYGDAWSYLQNPDGITEFWRDGLLRNRNFENVITMGMRGENDTAILGKDATLEDNISLLRSVLKTQNRLIRQTVNPNLDKVPRQLVLFTEVEEFFYGGKGVTGLMGDPELEGVTLMLSDNNFGSTRTLPSEEMRNHSGGFGMYYHMDMHGGPHSYQWIGSSYLPKVWEQMTMAYEYGVREIWVTNIGDIGTQELGLSYFLDLAYDIERWGGDSPAVTNDYIRQWIHRCFAGTFEPSELCDMFEALTGCAELLSRRKHEKMNEWTYHPVNFGEADEVLKKSERLLQICGNLHEKCPEKLLGAYVSLIHYPVCGTANLMKMWILAAKNRLYAMQNRLTANVAADEIRRCIAFDSLLTDEYHSVDGGKFNGLGLSEHIGFTTWDDSNNQYPIMRYVHPANTKRMIISKIDDERYVAGLPSFDRNMVFKDALRCDVDKIEFDISCAGQTPMGFRIETDCDWLSFSETEGKIDLTNRITLYIDKTKLDKRQKGYFYVSGVDFNARAKIAVEAENRTDMPESTFIESDGYICMKAANMLKSCSAASGCFKKLVPCTREGSAIKAYPVTTDFMKVPDPPYVIYRFEAAHDGEYNIRFYSEASTPVVYEGKQYIRFSVNGSEQVINTVLEPEKQFFLSAQANREATDHVKITESKVMVKRGVNELRLFAASPALTYEKIVLWQAGMKLKESYMGPKESFLTPLRTDDLKA